MMSPVWHEKAGIGLAFKDLIFKNEEFIMGQISIKNCSRALKSTISVDGGTDPWSSLSWPWSGIIH